MGSSQIKRPVETIVEQNTPLEAPKPKVQLTAEPRGIAKPRKQVDDFFDDPPQQVLPKSKPELLRSRGETGMSMAEDKKPKEKEKNFFDDDFEEEPLPRASAKPNLSKLGTGTSTNYSSSVNPLRMSTAQVGKREEQASNPYEEFEVKSIYGRRTSRRCSRA